MNTYCKDRKDNNDRIEDIETEVTAIILEFTIVK